MPRFEKDGYVIETSNPSESVTLRMSGFTETKARTAATRAADAEVAPEQVAPEQDAPPQDVPAQESQDEPAPKARTAAPKAKADKSTK